MALKFEITGDNRNLLEALDESRNGVHQAARDIEDSGLGIEDMFKRIGAAAGVAFSLDQAKSFISKVAEVRAYFQDIESSMEVFLGNQQKAAEFTQKLKDYAYYNMFEFSQLADASKQMIAYGHSVDTVIPRLDQLSNIATGTKADLMELVGLYNRAKSLGTVGSQALDSWATKGLVVKDVLKEMGVQASGTSVTFEQLNMVLDKVTSEGGMFHDLMLNQMENISAEQGQLQDNLDAMYNEIGEKYQDYITGVYKAESWLVDHYKEIAQVIADVIVAYGSYKGALMAAHAIEKLHTMTLTLQQTAHLQNVLATEAEIAAKGKATVATVLLDKAQKALNTTLLANPYALAAVAIAALTYGIYKMATAASEAELAEENLNSTLETLSDNQSEYNKDTENALSLAQSDSAATKDRADAMKLLTSRYSGIIEKYIDEKGHLRDILKLKQEIAILDGKRQREEKANVLNEKATNAQSVYKELMGYINGKNAFQNKNRIAEIRKKYKEETGGSFFGMPSLETMAEYYRSQFVQSNRAYARTLTENKLYDFTKEGGALSGYSDSQLKKLQKELQNANSKDNKNKSAYISDLKDYLTANDRQSLLTTVNGMLQARSGKSIRNKSVIEEERKNLLSQLEALDESEVSGKKGAELKKKIAALDKKLKAYSTTSKTGSKKDDTKERLSREEEKLEDMIDSVSLSRKRAEEDAQTRITNARLELMASSEEKVRRLQEQQHKEELEEIEREREDAVRKYIDEERKVFEQRESIKKTQNKNYTKKKFDESSVDVSAINERYDTIRDLTTQLQQKSAYQESLDSMREYLKQYGTLEEQKLAITQEYEKKIDEAIGKGDTYAASSLVFERDSKLEELGKADIFEGIDWEGVFENLEGHTTQYLESLRSKLQTILQSGSVTDITQIESLQSKINDINALISQQPSLFKFVSDAQIEHNRRLQEAVDAQERLTAAKVKEGEAADKLSSVQKTVFGSSQWNYYGDESLSIGDIDSKSAKQALDKIGKEKGLGSSEYRDFAKMVNDLIVAEGKLKTAREGVAKATDKAASAEDGAQETGKGKWNRIRSNIENSSAFANISSAPELLGTLGLGDASEKATKGLQGFNDGMGAVTDFMTGNYIGALQKGISAVTNLGEAFGFWSSSNMEESEAEIDRRNNANKELVKAMEDLTEAFKNSDFSSGIKTYEKALSVLNAQISNAAQAVGVKFGEYNGHHSTNYYGGTATAMLNDMARRANAAGYISNTKQAQDLNAVANTFTPAELDAIRSFDPTGWTNFIQEIRNADKADLGAADTFVAFVDDYSDAVKDLERQWKETVTGLSWDSLKSSFSSALTDMGKTVEDWKGDVDDILSENVANYISAKYTSTDTSGGKEAGRLAKWYDKLAEYTESAGIDAAEANELRKEYLAIQEEANAERDKWFATLGLDESDKKSDSEANATINAAKAMSDDTANQMVASNTAIRMGVESFRIQQREYNMTVSKQMGDCIDQLHEVSSMTTAGKNTLDDILEQHVISNQHLSDIAECNKAIREWGADIRSIRNKIETL